MKMSPARKAYVIFNYAFCFLIGLLCLLPVWHVLVTSFSGKNAIMSGKVTLWPVDFTFDNYTYVMKDYQFFSAFWISIKRTVLALVVQMFLTVLAAYPLSISKRKFAARQIYAWIYMFTMIFSGGMIPTYMVVSKTGLINSIWALILPGAIPVFNVILLQNYIKTLPEALSESAALDGAGHWRTLFQIILPLCAPSLATLCLFVAVNNWNAWFDGMLYINDNLKFPLQTYLRTLIVEVNMNQISDAEDLAQMVATAGADTAKIFIAMVPILCVYPFVQKHFVKGIVRGSVKE